MSISVLDTHLTPEADAVFPAEESGNLLYVDDAVNVSAEDMKAHAKVRELEGVGGREQPGTWIQTNKY